MIGRSAASSASVMLCDEFGLMTSKLTTILEADVDLRVLQTTVDSKNTHNQTSDFVDGKAKLVSMSHLRPSARIDRDR